MKYLSSLALAAACLSFLPFCAVIRPRLTSEPSAFVPPTLAPAPITTLLQAHCARCHSGASPGGGLDLTRIATNSEGRLGFQHRAAGRQKSAFETFAALYDRLTAIEPGRRMPPTGNMPEGDLELLFLWVEGALKDLDAPERSTKP